MEKWKLGRSIRNAVLMGCMLAGMLACSAQTSDAPELPEDQLIAIALAAVPGQVTGVEREQQIFNGQAIYEVDILTA